MRKNKRIVYVLQKRMKFKDMEMWADIYYSDDQKEVEERYKKEKENGSIVRVVEMDG